MVTQWLQGLVQLTLLTLPGGVCAGADEAVLPRLHIVAVGINYEDRADLKLTCPRNDAQAISKKLGAVCVGPKNVFGEVNMELLVNEKATTANIRKALQEVRKGVKSRDLLVFFYSGHGVREKQQFYLLAHDAKLDDLAKTALSGEDLRKLFMDCPCHVLVLLDASYSGEAAKALCGDKPATDDPSRKPTGAKCGVALLAAAMGHEKALDRPGDKNSLFTQALLSSLDRTQKDGLYNRLDGRQYVHQLFTEVLNQVQKESKDRQHPFLSLPWTIESIPLRRVAE